MKVLIAEDDRLTREGLCEVLRKEGYEVEAASDGLMALKLFDERMPDLLLLDVMMPGCDGYEVCRRVRAKNKQVPILFITAKGEEIDTVVGLELGADDYIVKPFGMREVVARMRAVARRWLSQNQQTESNAPERLLMGDLELFPQQLRALRGNDAIELSMREMKLLVFFVNNMGKVLDRQQLMNAGWSQDYLPSSRTLDQHISQLRKKIERDAANPQLIKTIHGVGYRYE